MHDTVALALLSLGGGTTVSNESLPLSPEVRIHTAYVEGQDTFVPTEFSIPRSDLGTGGIAVDEPEVTLVANAAAFVRAVAVIPTDPDSEKVIDDFVNSRLEEREGALL